MARLRESSGNPTLTGIVKNISDAANTGTLISTLIASMGPTGGITAQTAPDWLALDAVLCCGGSWMIPKGAPDLAAIEAAARIAAGFAR